MGILTLDCCNIPSFEREIVCNDEDFGVNSQVPTQPDRLMTGCGIDVWSGGPQSHVKAVTDSRLTASRLLDFKLIRQYSVGRYKFHVRCLDMSMLQLSSTRV